MKWLTGNCYYFGGLAAGYGLWSDHAHVWLWFAGAVILCFFGAAAMDRVP